MYTYTHKYISFFFLQIQGVFCKNLHRDIHDAPRGFEKNLERVGFIKLLDMYILVFFLIDMGALFCYKLHEICRSLQKIMFQNPASQLGWDGVESSTKMVFARNCMKCTDLQ